MLDVVVIGGGAVGSSLILGLLQHTPLSVGLVEAHDFEQADSHPGFDARAVALNAASINFYRGLNLEPEGAPIKHIQVSDKGHPGQVQLHHQDYQLPALGEVVELATLGRTLHRVLTSQKNSPHLHRYCPATARHIELQKDHATLTLDSGESLNCRLIVHAQGGPDALKFTGLAADTTDYEQTALITNVEMSQPHNGWAYERFTEHGPLALLPMTDSEQTMGTRMSVVWTLPPDKAEQLKEAESKQVREQLQGMLGYRQGMVKTVGMVETYPLKLRQLTSLISHRQVVVGNAAQTLHPIAGQGLNLGLRDVAGLLTAVTETQDCGDYQVLANYAKQRRPDRQRVIGLTDALVRLFSNTHSPLTLGRNLGLLGMELLPDLKKAFAMQSMGFTAVRNDVSLQGDSHA